MTCLKWLPGSTNLFLAAHASGHLYLYNEELPCTPTAPNYQPFKIGDGFSILTCKSKSTRNPLYKWTFGTDNSNINEICFSPCGSNLAIVSQDGFLRVFHYDTMELLGIARSYFGGFLCVCWSPDGKYIVVGGEDDLVTVWSLNQRRVVARGQGHRSWVSVVAFDPFTTSYSQWDGPEFSDDENPINDGHFGCYNDMENGDKTSKKRPNSSSIRDSIPPDKLATSYRLGSVSQDTQLCLWDITEDILRQPLGIRHRLSSHDPQVNGELITGQFNDVKVLKPIATISSTSSSSGTSVIGSGTTILNKDVIDSSGNKNNSFNKYATTNCASGSDSSKNSFNDNSKHSNSSVNSSKINNSIGVVNNFSKSCDSSVITTASGSGGATTSTSSDSGKNSSGSSKSSESGISAFNTLTQRLSNFGFGSDKKSEHYNHKKSFTLSKSSGNNSFLHNNNSSSIENNSSVSSSKNNKSLVSTYDPMKLIGTPVCPRFDECPVLEPLVCKKIAHERLTALIFREDCFLTACQDGFIYTWARPGFSVSEF